LAYSLGTGSCRFQTLSEAQNAGFVRDLVLCLGG